MLIAICILVLLLIGGGVMLAFTLPLSEKIYREQLVKETPEKWLRVCSAPENEEQMAMWEQGLAFAAAHREQMTEVTVENEGLHLYGELYAFGGDKCVVILPGRCECLCYSYFFAAPYAKAGYNVLVIDPRAHGKSDGIYNTVGVGESRDILKWVELLIREYHMQTIYFHAICVGTAGALLALNHPDCPPQVKGLITEGCFTSFRETFRQHMIRMNRPLFPVLDLVMWQIRRHTGTDVLRTAPLRQVKRLRQRVLFLFGRQDVFSIPQKSKKLVAACASPDKHLVWFEKGGHSHLRLYDPEAYDRAITDFLTEEHHA